MQFNNISNNDPYIGSNNNISFNQVVFKVGEAIQEKIEIRLLNFYSYLADMDKKTTWEMLEVSEVKLIKSYAYENIPTADSSMTNLVKEIVSLIFNKDQFDVESRIYRDGTKDLEESLRKCMFIKQSIVDGRTGYRIVLDRNDFNSFIKAKLDSIDFQNAAYSFEKAKSDTNSKVTEEELKNVKVLLGNLCRNDTTSPRYNLLKKKFAFLKENIKEFEIKPAENGQYSVRLYLQPFYRERGIPIKEGFFITDLDIKFILNFLRSNDILV